MQNSEGDPSVVNNSIQEAVNLLVKSR
jgi:hypothetical protein